MTEPDWDRYAERYRQIERGTAIPKLLREHMAERSGSAIDVGCGEGNLLARLAHAFPDWKLVGFEVSEFRANLARARGHQVFVDATGRVPDGQQHDLAISAHVIEHVRDDLAHAADLAALVKPGGTVYVETPLRLSGAWYFRRSPTAGWVLDPTHVREYRSVAALTGLLEAVGLQVVAQEALPLSFPAQAAEALVRRVLGLRTKVATTSPGLTIRIPRYRILSVLAVKAG